MQAGARSWYPYRGMEAGDEVREGLIFGLNSELFRCLIFCDFNFQFCWFRVLVTVVCCLTFAIFFDDVRVFRQIVQSSPFRRRRSVAPKASPTCCRSSKHRTLAAKRARRHRVLMSFFLVAHNISSIYFHSILQVVPKENQDEHEFQLKGYPLVN